MKPKLTVGRLVERLRDVLALEPLDSTGLDRDIVSANVSSPGLVLAGYVERFPAHRLQVFGETEISYLTSRSDDERREILTTFFSFPIPAVFVTKGQRPPTEMSDLAASAGVPIIGSRLKTNEFYTRIKPWL